MSSKKQEYASHDWGKTNGLDREVHLVMPGGPSLCRQEFAAECDINEIMRRYEVTGILPNDGREPQYVDFTALPRDLMSTMEILNDAEAAFMTLPARVRREFDNDPISFVAFAGDPENLDQMREWGLAPKPEPTVSPVPPAPQGGAGAPSAAQPAPGPAAPSAAPAAATQSST